MSKELEACFKRIKNLQVCVDYEKDIVKSVDEILPNSCNKIELPLTKYEAIKNAEPSKALKDVEELKELVEMNKKMKYKNIFTFNLDIIKQALIERIVWKNIHNTKVKIPLCDVFNNPTLLSKEERYKYIEHIYYHWEEMKEALEDKNNELEKENVELKAKAQKEHKALEIIKEKDVIIASLKCSPLLESYNSLVESWRNLTQEEFDLLKEVLKNE